MQTVEKNPVPLDLTYTARTVGSREVEVRARVGGILIKRRFEEGGSVKQGQPMFLIDPEPVRARLASALPTLRWRRLAWTKRAVSAIACCRCSKRTRSARAVATKWCRAFEVAQANLAAAESAQRMSQLDLEYTDVRAPISGLTSREVVSEGSLVSTEQSSSLLTKIVQIDPLYVGVFGARGRGDDHSRLARAGQQGRAADACGWCWKTARNIRTAPRLRSSTTPSI